MKPSELLKQITTLLSAEAKIELAKMNTADGVVLEAESFEPGLPVFEVLEEGSQPLPKGEYKLENGKTLVVVEDGIIEAVVEAEEETEIEVEAAEEVVEEEIKVEEPAEIVSQEEIVKAVIDAIVPMLEEMKAQIEQFKTEMGDYKQTKMSKVVHNPEGNQKQEFLKTTKRPSNSALESIFSKIN
jgi:Mg2+ and Co2+ transporter CorA